MSAYEVLGTQTPDKLIAGPDVPLLTKGVLLASGQGILARGSVIGIITTGGKGKLVNKANSDGSQVAKFVLADTVDTTSDDKMAVCYQSGLINREALVFGGASTVADHEAELLDSAIFLREQY
jgi:hypothetical protein